MLPPGTEEVAGEVPPEALLPLALFALSLGIPSAWYGLRRLRQMPPAPIEAAPATPAELVLSVPVLILSQIVVVSLLATIYGSLAETPPLAALCAVPIFLSPLALIAFLRACRGGSFRALGIGLSGRGYTRKALLAWLLFLPLLYGLVWASPPLYEAVGLRWTPQAHGEGIASLGGWSLALAAVLAVVLIPFFEELIFRGWMQQGLVRLLGPRTGLLLPAVLFTINHDTSVWFPILVLALLLGTLREQTQRLWPCVAVHVAHNGLQVVLIALGMHLQ